jgi:hypothetical protein
MALKRKVGIQEQQRSKRATSANCNAGFRPTSGAMSPNLMLEKLHPTDHYSGIWMMFKKKLCATPCK